MVKRQDVATFESGRSDHRIESSENVGSESTSQGCSEVKELEVWDRKGIQIIVFRVSELECHRGLTPHLIKIQVNKDGLHGIVPGMPSKRGRENTDQVRSGCL